MIDTTRRALLKGSVAGGAVGAAVAAGALAPQRVLADWNRAAFESRDQATALQALLGGRTATTDDAVHITANDPGGSTVVPVTVETSLTGVTAIALVAAGNEHPLVASFVLGPAALPVVSTRVRMDKTGDLIAVVKQGERLLGNAANVKIKVGGCSNA